MPTPPPRQPAIADSGAATSSPTCGRTGTPEKPATNQALLIQRARKLERTGLASEVEPGALDRVARAKPDLAGIRRARATSSRPCTGHWAGRAGRRQSIAGHVPHWQKVAEPIVSRVLDKGAGQRRKWTSRAAIDRRRGRALSITPRSIQPCRGGAARV